ncbi:MAG TPA: hypothetical protein PLI98_16905, partial [Candidatus Hydrogenedentes bacterium]|nr:hypothetical protein [Candidatus Hydrogenedentota bacterium]
MRNGLTAAVLVLACAFALPSNGEELRVEAVPAAGGHIAKVTDGRGDAFLPVAGEGLRMRQPAGETLVSFPVLSEEPGSVWRYAGGKAPGLLLTDAYRALGPELLERVVTVTAESDQRYTLDLGWRCPRKGVMYSF